MSAQLPKGWIMAAVAEVVEGAQSGFASGQKNVEGGVPHLRMNNIGFSGDLILDLVRRVPEHLVKPQNTLQRGDVLVCTTNSGKLVGKVAFFDQSGRYAFSNHLTRLRPKCDVMDGHFLRWNLWLRWKAGSFDDKCKQWVNQSTIPKEILMETAVAVPPLNEQHRIAAKLEQLLDKVDACKERLEKIPVILKRFRQSVLAAACSGRLTADWRQCNPDIKRYPVLSDPVLDGTELNGEFPATWQATRLGALTALITSGSRGWAKYYSDSGSIFIRAQNINADLLDFDDIAFVKLPARAEGLRTRVQRDDLLITITGANVTKSALVDKQIEDAYVSQHVALVRMLDTRSSKFLFYTIISVAHGRKQLQAAAYGQGKPGLNLDNIRGVVVALPPFPEQHEIVRRVEGLFALADQIETRYRKAKVHVDRLTQSILAKAFRGELVPQDPNDELASKLLERIRSETTDKRPQSRKKKRV